jgi:hypothetical protein
MVGDNTSGAGSGRGERGRRFDDADGPTARLNSVLSVLPGLPTSVITSRMTAGVVSDDPSLAAHGDGRSMWSRRTTAWPRLLGLREPQATVHENGQYVSAPPSRTHFATGYPLTEAYWAHQSGRHHTDVLIQV